MCVSRTGIVTHVMDGGPYAVQCVEEAGGCIIKLRIATWRGKLLSMWIGHSQYFYVKRGSFCALVENLIRIHKHLNLQKLLLDHLSWYSCWTKNTLQPLSFGVMHSFLRS